MEKMKYKLYDLVNFDTNSGVTGIGEVLGVAHAPMPVIGVGYIVRVIIHNTGTVSIPNDEYPFTHVVCSEVNMSCAH